MACPSRAKPQESAVSPRTTNLNQSNHSPLELVIPSEAEESPHSLHERTELSSTQSNHSPLGLSFRAKPQESAFSPRTTNLNQSNHSPLELVIPSEAEESPHLSRERSNQSSTQQQPLSPWLVIPERSRRNLHSLHGQPTSIKATTLPLACHSERSRGTHICERSELSPTQKESVILSEAAKRRSRRTCVPTQPEECHSERCRGTPHLSASAASYPQLNKKSVILSEAAKRRSRRPCVPTRPKVCHSERSRVIPNPTKTCHPERSRKAAQSKDLRLQFAAFIP